MQVLFDRYIDMLPRIQSGIEPTEDWMDAAQEELGEEQEMEAAVRTTLDLFVQHLTKLRAERVCSPSRFLDG